MLTLCLLAQEPHKFAGPMLHQPLFVITMPHRIAFNAEHLQLIQRAELMRQIVQAVVV